MIERIKDKLNILILKKDQYIDQVKAINGAIQALEELLKEEEVNGETIRK